MCQPLFATLSTMNRCLLQVVFCALLLTLMSSPAWGVCRSENRVGGSPVFSSDFASQETANPIGTRAENPSCGYDFASGVHKYLYAQDNPVVGTDPSGHDDDLDFGFNIRLGSIFGALSGYAPLLSESGLGAFTPVADGNRVAGIVFGETSLIVPQLMAGKSPGGPANWDSKSRASLNVAREKIAEVANLGRRKISAPMIPTPTTPVQTAQWQDCVDAANLAQGKTSQDSFVIWPSDDGKTPTKNPQHVGESWVYDYKPYVAFGAFRKVGSGGDVPEGNNIYMFFYTGIPF